MREYIVVDMEDIDSPHLILLSRKMGLHQDQVFGMLCRLRLWFMCNTEGGRAHNMTPDEVDIVLDHDGACELFITCGYLSRDKDGLSIPKLRALQSTTGRRRRYIRPVKSNMTIAQECLRANVRGSMPAIEDVEPEPAPTPSYAGDAKARAYLIDAISRTTEVGSVMRKWGESGADLRCTKSEARKAIAQALLDIQDAHNIDNLRAYQHLLNRVTKFKTHKAWSSPYRIGAMRWFSQGYYDDEALWENMTAGKQEGSVLPTEELRDVAKDYLEDKKDKLKEMLREHDNGL